MNCQECQQLLLESPDPLEPPKELQTHLTACPLCRQQQLLMVRIEANLPRVPVPVSQGKEVFLRQVLDPAQLNPGQVGMGPTEEVSTFPTLEMAAPAGPRKPSWSRWHWAAVGGGGMAAAVLLTVCGIWLGTLLSPNPRPGPGAQVKGSDKRNGADGAAKLKEKGPPSKPLVALIMDCDMRLAQAGSVIQRVEALADLADVLHDESRVLVQAGGAKELEALAQMYEKVLQKGLVARAQELAGPERKATLSPIVERLALAGKETEKLARQAPQASATPLQQIARAALSGKTKLRALVEEAIP